VKKKEKRARLAERALTELDGWIGQVKAEVTRGD